MLNAFCAFPKSVFENEDVVIIQLVLAVSAPHSCQSIVETVILLLDDHHYDRVCRSARGAEPLNALISEVMADVLQLSPGFVFERLDDHVLESLV